jgi:hypothetical protein
MLFQFFRSAKLRRAALLAGLAPALLGLSSAAHADDVASDDFEGLTLVPFDVANTGIGDGTDWTQAIPGWTIDNSLLGTFTDATAYNGWSAMDVDSWIAEQGVQAGRDRMRLGVSNNIALVADPDAWDDFPPGTQTNQGYTSYIYRTYDISGAIAADLEVSFDFDFVAEDWQRGVVEVTFDDPSSGTAVWQSLVDIQSDNYGVPPGLADNTVVTTVPTDGSAPADNLFVSGTDFTVDSGAVDMTVRFGCIDSGNDWWFSVDNVLVTDNGAFTDFEDFEGLTLLSFLDGGVGTPPGDGTDYTADVTNWEIDNSGMLTVSEEGAYQGFRAMDVQSWVNEQGGQQRSFLNEISIFGSNNTVLVADPDAHDDYDIELDDDDPLKEFKEYNSYISRTYDMSFFRNTTVNIEFDWECRVESTQRALVEASFDNGNTWVTMLDVDSDDPAKLAALDADYLYLGTDHYASFNEVDSYQFGGFGSELAAFNTNKMIVRIGLIDARNNWWFAVDNVRVTADPQAFIMGDANGDGVFNNSDIDPFVQALVDPSGYASSYPSIDPDQVLDFDANGALGNSDIDLFIATLLGF